MVNIIMFVFIRYFIMISDDGINDIENISDSITIDRCS